MTFRALLSLALLSLARADETCSGEGCGEKHVLTYFDGTTRAEGVRVALHAAGVPFEDKRMVYADYKELKASSADPTWTNGLPVLAVGDTHFTQSLAMLRYAGKKAGLYPDDAVAALAVDEILDICQDILTKCPSHDDAAEKQRLREEYSRPGGKMHSLVSLLAHKAGSNSEPNAFMVGNNLTIADLGVYYMILNTVREGQFDYIPSDYADEWRALVAIEESVATHPAVVAWTEHHAALEAEAKLLAKKAAEKAEFDARSKNWKKGSYTKASHMDAILQLAKQGSAVLEAELEKGIMGVDATDNNGWTAIMAAAATGSTRAIRALAKAGCRIDHRDYDLSTALMKATYRGEKKAVALLLELGANPNLQNVYEDDAHATVESAEHLEDSDKEEIATIIHQHKQGKGKEKDEL